MANLKEEATKYVPKQTLNIADLDVVDLSFPVEDRPGTDLEGKEFSYKVMVVNDQEYRVPATVLEGIKNILKLRPDTQKVKVTKRGSGLQTRYEVDIA